VITGSPQDLDSRSAPAPLPPPARVHSGRLRHLDFMRVVVFVFVISAHVVTNTLDLAEFGVAGWGMLMHFTRYAFVFISAFVLFYGYRDRKLRPLRFWRKRFSSVVLPYLLWTAIYFGLDTVNGTWPGLGIWLARYGLKVLWGNEWYHLYFLLVTIQFYFLFPAIRWLVGRCAGHHGWLLTGAVLVQAGFMWLVSAVRAPAEPVGVLWLHSEVMLPMYSLFLVGGALAALHLERMNAWLVVHGRTVAVAGAAGLAVTSGTFAVRARPDAWAAAAPEFPAVLPWAVAATLIVYVLGLAWSRRCPDDGLSARIVAAGAHRAFGVFAIHPLVLWGLEVTVVPALTTAIPDEPMRAAVVFLLTVTGALIAVELLLYTPLSRVLTARPRQGGHR
jgi:peptidoglycan/LPS O-acetylase OafA/YrhL